MMTVLPSTSGERKIVAIGLLAPLQFLEFLRRDRVDDFIGDAKSVDHVAIENAHTTRRDRSHRQLGMSRQTEFAHDEDIERHV